MAEHAPTTSRRAMLAGGSAALAALTPPTAASAVAVTPAAACASPDAAFIAFVEEFLAFHVEKEAGLSSLFDKRSEDWTAEDHALDRSATAEITGYLEDLAEIAAASPATPAGAVAQAKVALWHFKYAGPDDDEMLALRVAETVLRLQGVAMPEWAE